MTEIVDNIFNNSLEKEERLESLLLYYNQENNDLLDILNRICCTYFISSTNRIKQFLIHICLCKKISLLYRLEVVQQLKDMNTLEKIYDEEEDEFLKLPIQLRINILFYYLGATDETQLNKAKELYIKLLQDKSVDEFIRYRSVFKIQDKGDLFSLFTFSFFTAASIRYKILCSQYYLVSVKEGDYRTKYLDFLLETAKDSSLDEDTRADCCDVLLTTEYERESRLLLKDIGQKKGTFSIFSNSQNVHNKSIEKKALDIINILPSKIGPYTFSEELLTSKINLIKKYFLSICGYSERDQQNFYEGLDRIVIDKALYGNKSITIGELFCQLMTFIDDSEYKEELYRRMVEEVLESSNKCSSGFAERLVNVLSGFYDDMSLTISYEDEIISKIEKYLNVKIQEMSEDIEIVEKEFVKGEEKVVDVWRYNRDEVIEQMCINEQKFKERKAFLKFFRDRISDIRELLYQEYKHFLTDEDFDLYTRKACMHYLGY